MAEVEVLGSPFSNFVRSIRMVLEEKGVPYTLTETLPHTPEIDAIHPLGKIPCLKHGDFALGESRAIAAYIDRAFPGPKLFPEEAKAAALCEQWISILNTAAIPAFQAYMVAYYFPRTPDNQPDKAAAAAAFPQAEKFLGLIAAQVAATGYMTGNAFTYADIVALPVLYFLTQLPETAAVFKALPALDAYLAKHAARESFQATMPPSFDEFRKLLAERRTAAEATAKS